MNIYWNDPFSSSASSDEEFMIKQLLLTHEPDDRRLDSELLLRAVEDVMRHATASYDCGSHLNVHEMDDDLSNIEIVGSEETVPQIMWTILSEVMYKSSGKGNLHSRTMVLFDLLGKYGWDAKIVLALAAFAKCYGEFWVIMRLYHCHPLAVPIAMLRQFPVNLSTLTPQFKALSLLLKTMVDIAKCIIEFEGLPLRFVKLDDEVIATRKSCIYVAAYWVARSTLACSSQIKVLKANVPEQVYTNAGATAAWELVSLLNRLNSICNHLRRQVDLCRQQIEPKMYLKLSDSFRETLIDNQEVLAMLLVQKDNFPLKGYSTQAKLSVSELKDKVVVLLISKPELLPFERLLLLVQQTEDRYHKKSHEIVWIPISTSDTWSKAEAEMFKFLSNSLPWYSIRKPWALSSVVAKYIKQEWDYKDDPIVVVLDSEGKVSHSNAMDMVLLWGVPAYPFSSLKENELWEKESWTLQFLFDEIDPLLNRWVEEGKKVCLYGSDNLEWIREFNAKIKQIRNSGVQLDLLYVGSRKLSEKVRHILPIINEEMHSNLLSPTKLSFFWLRLESMRRSKLRQGKQIDSDHVLTEVTALLDNEHHGWALVGEGSRADIIKLQGTRGMECLGRFTEWADNVANLGFLGALRAALDPAPLVGPCYHSDKIPFVDGFVDGTVLCSKCSRPMRQYIIYE